MWYTVSVCMRLCHARGGAKKTPCLRIQQSSLDSLVWKALDRLGLEVEQSDHFWAQKSIASSCKS